MPAFSPSWPFVKNSTTTPLSRTGTVSEIRVGPAKAKGDAHKKMHNAMIELQRFIVFTRCGKSPSIRAG
jgi:hypothetical protein